MSSDDLLRAARIDAESTSQDLRPNAGDDGGGSERQSTHSDSVPERPATADRSADRSVVGVARFVPAGDPLNRLKGSTYVLVVDDVEVANVGTRFDMESARGFDGVLRVRVTTVTFPDRPGLQWHVGAEEPGPRPTKTKRSGREKELLFRASDRRAYVDEQSRVVGGYKVTTDRRRLVQTETPIGNRLDGLFSGFRFTTTLSANGTGYALRRSLGFTQRGAIGDSAKLAHKYPFRTAPWTVDIAWAVPLSVIVLSWHLLLGDIRMVGNG